jgi:hypothetical protein
MSVTSDRLPAPRHDPEMSNLVYKGGKSISQKDERVDCPGGVEHCDESNPHYHIRSTITCACGGSTQVQYARFSTLPSRRTHSIIEGRPTTTTNADNLNPCADCRRLLVREGA